MRRKMAGKNADGPREDWKRRAPDEAAKPTAALRPAREGRQAKTARRTILACPSFRRATLAG